MKYYCNPVCELKPDRDDLCVPVELSKFSNERVASVYVSNAFMIIFPSHYSHSELGGVCMCRTFLVVS